MKLSSLRAQRGVTLIEVLVALVIFAFGLLAAVGLQLSSLQSTQYTANSVIATAMAREYGELMQLVPDAASATSSATSSSTDTLMLNTDSIATTATANDCTGSSKTCTPAQLIAAMRNDWGLRVKSPQVLPQGKAEVCRDQTPRNASGDLEWGGCDETGEVVLVKMGWLGKPPVGTRDSGVDTSWMTADRPRFAVSVMGNLKDYVAH